jgi:hypothetical protein
MGLGVQIRTQGAHGTTEAPVRAAAAGLTTVVHAAAGRMATPTPDLSVGVAAAAVPVAVVEVLAVVAVADTKL